MSKFMDWFVAQHGKRERDIYSKTDDEMLRIRINTGEAARDELRRRQLWDGKQTSALYAWQAHESIGDSSDG